MFIILSKFGGNIILIFISGDREFLGYDLCDAHLFLGKVRIAHPTICVMPIYSGAS